MTRENKQSSIADDIFEQVFDHIYDLSTFACNPNHQLERWILSLLRNCLDFKGSYSILAHHSRNRKMPDLIVVKNRRPLLQIEIKPLGTRLDQGFENHSNAYLQILRKIPWKIVTNGYEWQLINLKSNGSQVVSFDLREKDALDLTKSGIQESCRILADLHVQNYERGLWNEDINAKKRENIQIKKNSPSSVTEELLLIPYNQ